MQAATAIARAQATGWPADERFMGRFLVVKRPA
jgi:hypothetical protein